MLAATSLVAALLGTLPLQAYGEPLLAYDFEQGTEAAALAGLSSTDGQLSIVPGGADGAGRCLRLLATRPGRYVTVRVTKPMPLGKNLVLAFDHRETIDAGKPAAYVGVLFFDDANKQWFGSDRFSDQWHHAEILVGKLHSPNGGVLSLGKVLSRLQIYGRAEGETQATMTVWLDNLRLEAREAAPAAGAPPRVSTANPPLFNWPPSGGRQRLAYSRDAAFLPDATVVVDCDKNFHTPLAPLAPGEWYWRVWSEDELTAGWSATQRLSLPPEAHRFTTVPVPIEQVAAQPHPRLISAGAVAATSQAQVVRRAQELARVGVPDDPPPFAPGNPEWPTWIDWYGKVHGGITSATGRRLQQMAEAYVQTRDSAVRELLRTMALKAAAWDPAGGSAMRRGDIGAHHLLRGLNWAYDALSDDLTPAQREQLRAVIGVRAEQFWQALNPFPAGGSEFNNHAWLKAFGLAESGLVLAGEDPRAAAWVEYVRQLYLGRFLCGLGYQGDNNEGIAYWGYGLMFVIDYAAMMKRVCGIDLFQHPWLYQTARFPMYCAPPGAWAVSFADTGKPNHGVRGPAETRQVLDLARNTGDPYALWYGGATEPVAGVSPRPPVDLPASIHYRFIGWAIFNTSLVDGRQGVTFALRSGPFYAGHQHEDQNGFVINAYGEKLAIDSGYYDWYGSEHFTKYSVLTRAHNALLIDGLDQGSRQAGGDGKITTYFDSPAYGCVTGVVAGPRLYQGRLRRWERNVVFAKPGVVVMRDVVAAATDPVHSDWLLHAVSPIVTDPDRHSFTVDRGGATLRGRFLAPTELSLSVKPGYPVEPVDGYSTRPVPPERYAHEWTLTAAPPGKHAATEFLTVLQIARAASSSPPAMAAEALAVTGGVGARLAGSAETQLVLFGTGDGDQPVAGGGVEARADTVAVALDKRGDPVRVCATNAQWLQVHGRRVFEVRPGPAAISLLRTEAGLLANVALPAAAQLVLPGEGPARELLVDGKRVRPSLAAGDRLLLDLPAGDHEVAVGARPEMIGSHALPPLSLGATKLEGYAQRQADGLSSYWWGSCETPRTDRYRFVVEGWQGQELPAVTCDATAMEGARSGDEVRSTRWLAAGRHVLTIAGRGSLAGVQVAGDGVKLCEARMLPPEWSPPATSIVVEAEAVALEGAVKGLLAPKVAASGGTAHCSWDTDGQWAEWRFGVNQAGSYRLLLRGASEYAAALRCVLLDGAPLAGGVEAVRLSGTGGWCRTANDWRYLEVCDAAGEPVRSRLTAGEHRLRIERISGSMNLDCFVWQPAD